MKRVLYLAAILLLSSWMARADETITVSATNSDIASNLDLKVVAKLFGEAKDLEDFELRLNNPDSAFVNLDLNGDGDVDYIRVIETTNGNRHLIVLQAVLAKDIYQDVASIFVEKDEATNQVSVQVIGDEYIYGENYVIEPVYIYRPVIYDWFWSPYWTCWNSPWYWGYYPVWWHPWACVHVYAYYDHCYHFHHHHHGCSFHYAQSARPASRTMQEGVRRNDYARVNPDRSFVARNAGLTNARQLPSTRVSATNRTNAVNGTAATRIGTPATNRVGADRAYGSSYTASRSTATAVKPASATNTTRSAGNSVATRSGSVSTTNRTSTTATNRTGTATTTQSYTRSGVSSTVQSNSRSGGSANSGRSTVTSSTSRSGSSTTYRSSSSTSRSGSSTTYRPSSSSSTQQSSHGSFGGSSFGGSRSSGGSYGGGGGGSSSRGGGGGGASTRR